MATTAEMLDVITAADRQEDWRIDGATSMAAWLVGMLHVSYATAKEWVRVGAALDQLSHLRDAFAAGMLSWDQVRHATVFVTPDDDEDAAQNLTSYSAAQVEEMARFARARDRRDADAAQREQMFTWRKDRDTGGFRYRGFLTAETGALVNAALEQRAQRIGPDPATGVWGSEDARRDGGTCRFAGCDRPIRHFHHIQHWTNGGATDSYNLVGLCWNHHHLVHEGGWTIDGNPDIEITFTSPYGRTLTSRPRPLDPNIRRRVQNTTGTDLHATGTDPPL